jgi:hypothetical protein
LAPKSSRVPASFNRTVADWTSYWSLLHEMQRFRGKVYVEDGAIDESCLVEGRHQAEADFSSWHLLVLNSQERVCGCLRLHEHPKPVVLSELNVGRCALAKDLEWSSALTNALKEELSFSTEVNLAFGELGGWALDEEIRGSTEALRFALASYAFAQMLGGAVCVTTATHRHCSASILRRIGGRPLTHQGMELPAYYEPQYDCKMEILKFYSWAPNPRYAMWIKQMREELSRVTVIFRHHGDQGWLYGHPLARPASLKAHAQVA